MKPITNVSDQAYDYAHALAECDTLDKLAALLAAYRMLAPDAIEAAPRNDVEFVEFYDGLVAEHAGQHAGESFVKRYGPVMMPGMMLRVAFVATEFGVPWGCAYIRLRDLGRIVERDGVATWMPRVNGNA